jgi:hypothetical protein
MNATSHQVGLVVIDEAGFESAGAETFLRTPFLRSRSTSLEGCHLPSVPEFKCSDYKIEKCAISGIYKLVYSAVVLMGALILVAPHSISRDSRPVLSYSVANVLRIFAPTTIYQVYIAWYSLHEKVVYSDLTQH